MKIDKTTDCYLFNDYKMYSLYKKANRGVQKAYVDTYIKTLPSSYVRFLMSDYADSLPSPYDKDSVYKATWKQAFDCLYKKFNVEYVNDSFSKIAFDNKEKLVETINEIGFYKAFGECAGYLLFGNYCFTYSITEHFSYFTTEYRNASECDIEKVTVTWDDNVKILIDSNELNTAMRTGIAILVVKHFGEVETALIGAGAKRNVSETDNNVLKNDTPFKINYLDSSWLKTIIRTEGFLVRGFFRLQACGVGWGERKLIYIKPFMKNGYTRRAKKLLYQEKSIKESFAA